MKKIGLVPLEYNSFNYGGTLQNYALQQTLLKHSSNIYVFNFDDFKDTKLFPSSKSSIQKTNKFKIKKKVQGIFNYLFKNDIKAKKLKFIEFRDIHFADMIKPDKSNIHEISKEFNGFYCGSDQIWNPYWANESHFLSFVPEDIPKFSYAASIGVGELNNKQASVYKPLVNEFDLISVREKSAKSILNPLLNKNKEIEVVLDPTLLLSAVEWDSILSKNKIKNKYIFTYFLGEDEELRDYAKSLSKLLNLKIINIPYLYGEFRKSDYLFGDLKATDAGPQDFINLIKHAEIILTDSFHACVFSIIYHKNFYVFDRKVYGKSMSTRISGLLEMLEISGHIIDTDHSLSQLTRNDIDYTLVDFNLNKQKEISLSYLEKSFKFIL